jgi:hypothetical protein
VERLGAPLPASASAPLLLPPFRRSAKRVREERRPLKALAIGCRTAISHKSHKEPSKIMSLSLRRPPVYLIMNKMRGVDKHFSKKPEIHSPTPFESCASALHFSQRFQCTFF